MIKIKRAYDAPDPADGYRVLVDRLWPRGLSKRDAAIDAWMKDLAPSAELRKWFDHEAEKWPEFQEKYTRELERSTHNAGLTELLDRASKDDVTLLFAARDRLRNNAMVLKIALNRRANEPAKNA